MAQHYLPKDLSDYLAEKPKDHLAELVRRDMDGFVPPNACPKCGRTRKPKAKVCWLCGTSYE